ncbi:MAG: hypothetical protein UZ20_WS6002000316 [candidate division WS6 bacterium OLB21]|uniref:Uncharacterized protein n=1 Tax=candidate division WS6 bacterium OLB21 TaxID=1617427 RepID=A0A136KKC3_9BACT|nr:MAG: hypothetical protein UZ20_WS6002000316 [candidate division WS6 bacterium OLB21]
MKAAIIGAKLNNKSNIEAQIIKKALQEKGRIC